MRKNVWVCMLLAVVLVSCDWKKSASVPGYDDRLLVDSLVNVPDSLMFSPESGEEEGFPESSNELFDDFIFEFSRLEKVQYRRVEFPFPSVADGDTVWIDKKQWTYEPLFNHQDYYTIFYCNEKQMELDECTDLNQVDVEQIDLDRRTFKVWRFEKRTGKWFLTGVALRPFNASPLDRFMDFYRGFATDSVFQVQHIADPLRYLTTDPEDDFNTIEGTLDHEQWEAFKPQLPSGVIFNIRYGQEYDCPRHMIMVKAGISNGMIDILTFKKKGSEWKMVSYEN